MTKLRSAVILIRQQGICSIHISSNMEYIQCFECIGITDGSNQCRIKQNVHATDIPCQEAVDAAQAYLNQCTPEQLMEELL